MVEPTKLCLLPYQNDTLQDGRQFLLWHGGRGSAKSTTLVMAMYLAAVKHPGSKLALVCNDHVQLRDSTHENLVRFLNAIQCPFRYRSAAKVLHLPNGSSVHELTFEKDVSSLKGPEWDGVYIDEADGHNTTEDKFDYLVDSCRGKKGDRLIRIACNPVPPGHFLAQRFFVKPRPNHRGIKVTTYQNASNLPKDYIANLEQKYPPGTLEHARWMLGELVTLSGAVYKSFSTELIIDPGKIPHMQAWAYGQDLGVNDPHVLLEGGLDHLGRLYVTREYYRAGMAIDEHLPYLQDMYQDGWPVFSDHSATQHSIMRRAGFNMVNANKDVHPGIQQVQHRLHTKSLFVSSACENLIRDLYNYVWRPTTVAGREVPDHKFSHAADALRYLVMGIDAEALITPA